jgi:hypothetical protein
MARTILIDEPVEIPGEYLDFARSFIGACRFRTPKNLPHSPHEYQARISLDAVNRVGFDRFAALIDNHGYRGTFLYVVYVYLDVDGRRYWISNAYFPPAQRGMLNRASNELSPPLRPDDPLVIAHDPSIMEWVS